MYNKACNNGFYLPFQWQHHYYKSDASFLERSGSSTTCWSVPGDTNECTAPRPRILLNITQKENYLETNVPDVNAISLSSTSRLYPVNFLTPLMKEVGKNQVSIVERTSWISKENTGEGLWAVTLKRKSHKRKPLLQWSISSLPFNLGMVANFSAQMTIT